MNEKERSIISSLRKDARTSLASIAQEVQVPISTIYDKINRLHREKVIKKYTALLDFPQLGYHYHATLAIRVSPAQKGELLLFLQQHHSINSIHVINGGFDFLVETIHRDIKEYLAFREGLQQSYNTIHFQEYQLIEEVEREKFL